MASADSTITQLHSALASYFQNISTNVNLKVIDLFNLGLVAIAVLQFLFMLLIRDTFPFNAFLSGFICCVSQFVLNVSLRLQLVKNFEVKESNKKEGTETETISEKRAFAEYVFASLILHFVCLHFIN